MARATAYREGQHIGRLGYKCGLCHCLHVWLLLLLLLLLLPLRHSLDLWLLLLLHLHLLRLWLLLLLLLLHLHLLLLLRLWLLHLWLLQLLAGLRLLQLLAGLRLLCASPQHHLLPQHLLHAPLSGRPGHSHRLHTRRTQTPHTHTHGQGLCSLDTHGLYVRFLAHGNCGEVTVARCPDTRRAPHRQNREYTAHRS